jgi:hypothetical protein
MTGGRMLGEKEFPRIYAARHVLDLDLEKILGIQIPFDMYIQDPLVAAEDPMFGFGEKVYVLREPGLTDGPTSARLVVVDYNGDTDTIIPPAKWNKEEHVFKDGNQLLDRDNTSPLQFHQVNVWVALQQALTFYQQGQGLGRTIPWGFEGNRLIVVPHAGYCENAFYDRQSKSLQFYYFGPEHKRVYTCLSADIINHEFGHAILDGIRPHFLESSSVETAAFHEFIGDLTAILILLRNNEFRRKLADKTQGNLNEADKLAFIAEEFGRTVNDKPYLRNATVKTKMSEVKDDDRPHFVSQVLTGALYEILVSLSQQYINNREETYKEAYWNAIKRMQPTALQPLDLLPPVDVTFKDYALAVLRCEEVTNPKDPYGYYQSMLDVFKSREILDDQDIEKLQKKKYLFEDLDVDVFYDIDYLKSSRSAAYNFLNDNRSKLFIPGNRDFIVADLYETAKMGREGGRLPREIILEYIWQEDVKLEGAQFGFLDGKTTTMACGGTLVFNESGNRIYWSRKPGTQLKQGKKNDAENAAGVIRREELLADYSKRIRNGQIGPEHGGEKGLIGLRTSPVTMKNENGKVRLELSPQMTLDGDESDSGMGGRKWQISF